MCPEESHRDGGLLRAFASLAGNPLYEYLLDLQERRIRLVEALAPGRHVTWQIWLGVSFALLWMADAFVPGLKGLPVVLLVLLGPIVLFGGLYVAGWNAQMIALRNYPSPFDFPHALELLLATPLTEAEITAATIAAFARYPFIGVSWKRLVLVAVNIAILAAAVVESMYRGSLPVEVPAMAMKLYAPALCVFAFFPLLTALDMLLVPVGWLKHSSKEPAGEESVIGRTGRLPALATFLALTPLIYMINRQNPFDLHTTVRVLTTACPIILAATAIATAVLICFAPGHLRRVRRS